MTLQGVVSEFVNYQTQLLSALSEEHPSLAPHANCIKMDALRELPWEFDITCNGDVWKCRRHGNGIWFENRSTGIVIDAHKNIELHEAFDAWRLSTFLESKKIKSYSVSNIDFGSTEREIESALQALLSESFIEVDKETNLMRIKVKGS